MTNYTMDFRLLWVTRTYSYGPYKELREKQPSSESPIQNLLDADTGNKYSIIKCDSMDGQFF